MSAPPLLAFRGQTRFATPILRGGPYVSDCNHSFHLLAAVCLEQQGRFHALQLLTEYLARCAGRQIVDSEIKALWEFYEANWCELASAFPAKLVRWARAAVGAACIPNRRMRSAVVVLDARVAKAKLDGVSPTR
jgi:hypothetical protein